MPCEKKVRLSQSELAEKTGQSMRTIRRIETGKWRSALDVVYALANFFEVLPEELGPTLKDRLIAPNNNKYTSVPYASKPVISLDGQSIYLPYYRMAASADEDMLAHEPELYQSLSFKSKWVQNVLKSKPKNLFLIDVIGDSMEPTFHSGDTVLIDTERAHLRSNGFYVFRLEDNLFVKKVEILVDGKIMIKSDNPNYETIILEEERERELEVFGRVVWRAEVMIS